jgi:hypothetical protein
MSVLTAFSAQDALTIAMEICIGTAERVALARIK